VIEKSLYAYAYTENADEQGIDSGSNSPAKAENKCQGGDDGQNRHPIFYYLLRQMSIADKLTFSDAAFGFV
jgi:hypothetical protein